MNAQHRATVTRLGKLSWVARIEEQVDEGVWFTLPSTYGITEAAAIRKARRAIRRRKRRLAWFDSRREIDL